MVGFLTKPLDAPVVFTEIQRHLAAQSRTDESLRTLFQDDPVRRQRVFAALANEFTQHQNTLRTASEAGNAAGLRALRHQLHTAINQFQLTALETALDQLIQDPKNSAARTAALTSLEQAAKAFGKQQGTAG